MLTHKLTSLASRLVIRMVLRLVSVFIVYLGAQFLVLSITDSPVWAAIGGAVSTVPMYWILHTVTPDTSGIRVRRTSVSKISLWLIALAPIWLAGQALAIWVYNTFPDAAAGYERRVQALDASPEIAMLLLTLLIAPITEELLMRGILFRELRHGLRLPLFVSMLISSIVFATLHFSAVQFGATLLLGLFLSLVYEYTGSILVPILIHGVYNVLSTFVPIEVVTPFVEPGLLVLLWVTSLAAVTLLTALRSR